MYIIHVVHCPVLYAHLDLHLYYVCLLNVLMSFNVSVHRAKLHHGVLLQLWLLLKEMNICILDLDLSENTARKNAQSIFICSSIKTNTQSNPVCCLLCHIILESAHFQHHLQYILSRTHLRDIQCDYDHPHHDLF